MPLKPKDNLTYKQRQALKKLIINDTIIINTLDQHTIHHNTARFTPSQPTPESEQNLKAKENHNTTQHNTKHNTCPIPPARTPSPKSTLLQQPASHQQYRPHQIHLTDN